MAVTESSKVSVLRLKFAVGETSGGDIKYKRKDIKNVKADATKEDVYAVGKALSDLLETKADVIAKVDENWLTNYCALNGIKVITVDYRYLTPSLVEKCRSKGITLYMNTINNQNDANKYKSQGVYGFFTDFLTP